MNNLQGHSSQRILRVLDAFGGRGCRRRQLGEMGVGRMKNGERGTLSHVSPPHTPAAKVARTGLL